MTNYENFNNSSKSFRIYCDKLTSTDICNNLILESSNNNIELKVVNNKKIIFKNDVVFNSSMDLNNKPLVGLTTISAESLNINNILSNTNLNIDFSNNILSYTNINGGYIKNTQIGYNPNIAGDKGSTSGRRDAYFTYIDVSGADSSFNNSLYVKNNIIVDGSASITSDLSVNAISLASMLTKLSFIEDYIYNMVNSGAIEFSNNRINVRDLSATNITISNELYVLNKYYANDLNISGQILSAVLRVPHEFTIEPDASFNNNENFVRIIDNSWVPMGRPIIGEAPEDINERYVALNADGNILAIGAPYNDSNRGQVIVYKYNSADASWVSIGQSIDGVSQGDHVGYSISLNADGNRVAIGAQYNEQGHVRVYEYRISDASWIQIGQTIDGNVSGDNNARSISLNYDGNILAIGEHNYNDYRGQVRVYEYRINNSDTSWVQLGTNIDGDTPDDQFGYSISLNNDGTRVAISAPSNNIYRGQVRVYEYISDTSWVPIGQAIVGEAAFDQIGDSISLNPFGNIIAIGARYNSIPNGSNNQQGRVRIYEYINDTSWVPIGQPIDGEERGDQLGYSISLNAVGNIVSIGARGDYGNEFVNITRGFVKVYQYVNDTSWVPIGSTIYGEESGDSTRWSVSLNYAGTKLAIGFPINNRVLVYQHVTSLAPTNGSLVVNGNLIVRGNKKTIKSSIIDISAFSIKIATNLINKADLSNNPAGFDVSYIAALHYDGTTWNISGGNLLIKNQSVGLDISLIDLQRTISGSLIASKLKYDSSFTLLQSNIDNSFNNLYTISQVDNSYVTISYANTKVNDLKYYIDQSFVTNQTFSISRNSILQNYVTKAYVDGSFSALNNRLDLSFALKNSVDLSYSTLNTQLVSSFTNAAASNVDISSITIENIKTPNLALSSHVLINGDLIVASDTSCNSLNVSNSYIFSNNGYSSIYSPSSNASTIIEEYYSKFNNFGKVFYILADGSLYSLSGRGAISDSRLKENIVDASPKLEDLLKVRIVDYNLKNNANKKYIGVVAQELEELFPSLVETESPSAHTIENGITTNYKSVKYSCFNVMLIKALQEEQQIITNLTLRLERLKQKMRK